MVDPQGRVVTWNTGAARIFGYAQSEIAGRDGGVLFTPEDRANGEHQQELARAADEGRAADDRWHMPRGGGRFYASGIPTPLRGADGSLHGFV
jgi:two-component system CheB/CheR fusion protein